MQGKASSTTTTSDPKARNVVPGIRIMFQLRSRNYNHRTCKIWGECMHSPGSMDPNCPCHRRPRHPQGACPRRMPFPAGCRAPPPPRQPRSPISPRAMEPSPDNPGHATLTLTQPPKCQNPRGRRSSRRRRRERTHLVTGRLPLHKSWTSTNRPEEERKRAAELRRRRRNCGDRRGRVKGRGGGLGITYWMDGGANTIITFSQ